MPHYYVRLKENHTLNLLEAEQVRKMELLTPEERWVEVKNELGLIEIYKKGTEQECQDFMSNIEGDDLKTQFEIIKR